jgi:UDP-3-O-[3-hydroxymyristoyl] N-acetylglucosamine deacetylase
MVKNQRTIKHKLFFEGVGVHSGTRSSVTLYPAAANRGIIVKNKSIDDDQDVIKLGTVIPEQAMHATILRGKRWSVSTIEHLMSAIHGLGLDNLLIEIEGAELPILDGSALPFVQAIMSVGIESQDAQKIFLTPKRALRFEHDGKFIEITPAREGDFSLAFSFSIDFEHPLIQSTMLSGRLSHDFFSKEISPARTFGFLEQLPLLRKHGLAKGANLGNSVVVGKEIFLNSRRFENEFIRHKLLDLIGDLGLTGKTLIGTIKAHRTGHLFNRSVIESFVKTPEKWTFR